MSEMNKTTSPNLSVEMKTFYDRTLLERMLPNLPFLKYGQKRPIPKGNGKSIEFRKFSSLQPATTPLAEGVPPAGSTLSATAITATVNQYGDFIELSDVLETTAIDPIITETVELEGEQAGETLNIVTRDVLLNATNEYNVGGGVDINAITLADKLTSDEVLKIRTIFKRNNVKPLKDGYFLMFLAPEQAADIMRDELWRDVSSYANNAKNIEDGEIGRLYDFKFIDTTLVDAEENTNNVPVYSGIAIGQNAYGIVDIENGSKPKTIIKIAKEDDGDKSDPLNQKSTIGWKAMMTAVILNQLAVMRINSAATNVSGTVSEAPATVTISATAGENGSVSPASITVTKGATVTIDGATLSCDGKTITAIADSDYEVDAWDGLTNGATVTEDKAVSVSFKSSL